MSGGVANGRVAVATVAQSPIRQDTDGQPNSAAEGEMEIPAATQGAAGVVFGRDVVLEDAGVGPFPSALFFRFASTWARSTRSIFGSSQCRVTVDQRSINRSNRGVIGELLKGVETVDDLAHQVPHGVSGQSEPYLSPGGQCDGGWWRWCPRAEGKGS